MSGLFLSNRIFSMLTLLVASILTGCASTGVKPVGSQDYFRGLLRASEASLELRDCDAFNWRAVELVNKGLETRLLQRLSTLPQGVSIYVEAWGKGADPLQTLQMLGGDLATCEHLLKGATLRAGGLNPVWYADLKTDELQIHNSTAMRSWRLTQPDFSRAGDLWIWQSEGAKLAVWRERCEDAIGIEYALTAQFTAGSTQLAGCARYGDLSRALLKTRYYSRDPGLLRQLGLQLWWNDKVRLSLISSDGSSERYDGRWQVLNSGDILLRFDDERLRGQSRSLRLKTDDEGLRVITPHPVFGSGALLYPGNETLLSQQRHEGRIP